MFELSQYELGNPISGSVLTLNFLPSWRSWTCHVPDLYVTAVSSSEPPHAAVSIFNFMSPSVPQWATISERGYTLSDLLRTRTRGKDRCFQPIAAISADQTLAVGPKYSLSSARYMQLSADGICVRSPKIFATLIAHNLQSLETGNTLQILPNEAHVYDSAVTSVTVFSTFRVRLACTPASKRSN